MERNLGAAGTPAGSLPQLPRCLVSNERSKRGANRRRRPGFYMSFECDRPWRGDQGRTLAIARRSAPLGGQLPSPSWSSGHDSIPLLAGNVSALAPMKGGAGGTAAGVVRASTDIFQGQRRFVRQPAHSGRARRRRGLDHVAWHLPKDVGEMTESNLIRILEHPLCQPCAPLLVRSEQTRVLRGTSQFLFLGG